MWLEPSCYRFVPFSINRCCARGDLHTSSHPRACSDGSAFRTHSQPQKPSPWFTNHSASNHSLSLNSPLTLVKLKKVFTITTHNGSSIVPTSFEVILALVWILRTKALRIDPHEATKLLIAVDSQPKFNPPLPSGYFRNGLVWSCAECGASELIHKPFSFAVQTVHEALRCVTGSYIRSAIGHVELNRVVVDREGNTCCINKWSRLPFYKTDFGFGRPFQVAPAAVPHNDVLVYSQSEESDNLVASLGLPRDAMDVFLKLIQSELALKSKF